MINKFKNKYRIPSARWRVWDYGTNAAYFVTICTAHREWFFGEITDGKMRLSDIGRIAQSEWLKTPELRPDMNLTLGSYVIMPNHFHCIIVIGRNQYNAATSKWQPNKFEPQSKNLASVIRGFKISVTKNARQLGYRFAWQPRFHDHVIRNFNEYRKIAHYIDTNISNWHNDKFHGL